ncbi:Mucin-associated surface protein (MASP) [Trypanosoma cruzi]|uniref:Mucin-associated surface protein (MASP) n=1 Tax=Trypanosoma cruzi TaxID=5693 RepID=A0A2V2WA60_TRYCR|nr:Mucin-associated surface protein (MASP) [Trypanosoma cruzi]
MNIFCTSRGPTIRVVCVDLSFLLLLLCFCVAVCAAPPLVCVRTPREGCRHDGPLSPCVHAVGPCVPLLFAPPLPSVCCCCGRAVCVCVPVAVDWSVCRAWCAAYGACLAAALSSCGVPSVCVCRTSRLPCCSPCPSLCRSAPHHRTTTLTMMMTCRLLCALLVLALCCCPSVCVMASDDVEQEDPSLPPTLEDPGPGENSLGLNPHTDPNSFIVSVSSQPVTAVAGEPSNLPFTSQEREVAPGQSVSDGGKNNLTDSTGNSNEPVVKKQGQGTEGSKTNKELEVQIPNTKNKNMTEPLPPPPLPPPPPTKTITSAVPPPKASPAATVPEKGKGLPAPNLSQVSTEQMKENAPSQKETAPEALKQLSGEGTAEQQEPERDKSTLAEITDSGSLAETTAPSISTNGSDDAQSTVDDSNDDDPRPNHKETGDHNAANTKVASLPSETSPQKKGTVTAAQTSATRTPDESDSSTAVSHTTSPLLLLLLVACAAAAAVAAA